MKICRVDTGIISLSFILGRGRWYGLPAICVAALLLLLPMGARPALAQMKTATAATNAHVYLLRGVLNIFSLGLDDIAAQLQAQGIPVTIANFASWSSLADDAARAYKNGGVKKIILVGHSSGATALPDMVAKLDQLGAPVTLAIGLDSVFRTKLSGRVGRYINFYIANGNGEPVAGTTNLRGKLENINVQNVPGVGHLSIEKNQSMQRRVISEIDAVVFGRVAPTSRAQKPSPVRAASRARLRTTNTAAVRR